MCPVKLTITQLFIELVLEMKLKSVLTTTNPSSTEN